MAKFIIKNLPRGFVYLVPPHRMRPFVKLYGGQFIRVEYDGTSMSEQSAWKWQRNWSRRSYHLGIFYTHEDEADNIWKFWLVLNGVREANLPEDQEEEEKLAAQLVADIEARISHVMALPPTGPRHVGDLFLGYDFNAERREAEYSSFIPA